MCRWLAYSGNPIPLEALLVIPEHNLIDQSFSALSSSYPTNGDGFGVGWYGSGRQPGLFRSLRPAWNDFNLLDLAAHIDSALFLAHVRASSCSTRTAIRSAMTTGCSYITAKSGRSIRCDAT